VLDKNKITVIVAFLFIAFNAMAQQGISSIGSIGGTTANISAINFNSISTCIDVKSGIVVLTGKRASGYFAINCEVSMQYNSLGVKLFPNPVQNSTKVKSTNTPPLNEVFNLTIVNASGAIISTRKETGYTLFQGLTLDLSSLQSGTYVLKIDSPKFIDVVKFIKAGN
jgi:Secretion system C-terminal sorting domain